MIRPIFTEIGLFLVPFVLYAVFLAITNAGVLQPKAWRPSRLAALLCRFAAIDVREFLDPGAIFRRSARLHLRAGAHRERQIRTGDDTVTAPVQLADAAWLTAR